MKRLHTGVLSHSPQQRCLIFDELFVGAGHLGTPRMRQIDNDQPPEFDIVRQIEERLCNLCSIRI